MSPKKHRAAIKDCDEQPVTGWSWGKIHEQEHTARSEKGERQSKSYSTLLL